MKPEPFDKSFTQQKALDADAIDAAVAVMRSGRLHRYNVRRGEASEVSKLEAEYAAYQGVPYCLACASGGYALQVALRATGLTAGDPVLTNAFTLAPVPGAIVAAGGRPVLVEITPQLTIDFGDLERKCEASRAHVLCLSLMRGHLPDMERLIAVTDTLGIRVIEDCAHTMGATWKETKSGNFGLAGCFSTQTYKHLNSGEGGLITSSDAEFMARAILLSGSYMFFDRHGAAPPVRVFESLVPVTPNCSGRMDNLRAAVLRPQLAKLADNIARWNARYRVLETGLARSGAFRLVERPPEEHFVGSSIQFRVDGISNEAARHFVAGAQSLGVELKWFGASRPAGFTSLHHHWAYAGQQHLPSTDAVLQELFDMRIPLTFTESDCEQIADILCYCAATVLSEDQRNCNNGIQ